MTSWHRGMEAHDGYVAHSHEVRPDHDGVARRPGVPSVPVPVLEALAGDWEEQADRLCYAPGDDEAIASQAFAMQECARMLREAITHGGAG